MFNGVMRLKAIVTAMVTLLWVPATMHCGLETLTNLEFLSCCAHETDETMPGHHENDCSEDECAAVESGLYKQEETSTTLVRPTSTVSDAAAVLLAETERRKAPGPFPDGVLPPELRRMWPILMRGSIQPRAPSIIS